MNQVLRRTRIGFVVIKLLVGGAPYFLMRVNPKWKDVNFIGGHEKDRDGGNLGKTARRELWEEVPSIRSYKDFSLEPLTPVIHHGPILSRSRGNEVEYDVQFFLLRISGALEALVEMPSPRTKNVLILERDLLTEGRVRASGLVQLLDGLLTGGLASVPYSSPVELRIPRMTLADHSQLRFAWK